MASREWSEAQDYGPWNLKQWWYQCCHAKVTITKWLGWRDLGGEKFAIQVVLTLLSDFKHRKGVFLPDKRLWLQDWKMWGNKNRKGVFDFRILSWKHYHSWSLRVCFWKVTETQKERMIVFQLSFFRGRVVKLWSAFFCSIRNIFQLFQCQLMPPQKNDERNMVSSFLLDMFWICFGYVLRTPKNLKLSKNTPMGAKSSPPFAVSDIQAMIPGAEALEAPGSFGGGRAAAMCQVT